MRNGKIPKAITLAFLIGEGGLYGLFLTLDLLGMNTWGLRVKYAGILLCLFYCILCWLFGAGPLVPCALGLTAWADWYLLIADEYYLAGTGLFLAVQILYLLTLWRRGAGLGLWLRLPLAAACGLAVWLSGLLSPLNLLAGLYFSQLLANMILAWRHWRPVGFLLALGLTLFVCCDLNVGLYNLEAWIPAWLHDAADFSMWLFYLPSQVLISLSAFSGKEPDPT